MNIHEYQGKEVFRQFGIPTPDGVACFSVEEAEAAAQKLGGKVWVVKAQIHAGGRGKGGGVKVAKTREEVREYAGAILGMNLVTHQTGKEGREVKRLLIEKGANITDELYAGVVVDRARQCPVLMASSEGGMEIEKVAADTPDKIHKIWANARGEFGEGEALTLAEKIGVPPDARAAAADMFTKLGKCFVERDCSLLEINPLAVLANGSLCALDAKINFDDNAIFRRSENAELRDMDEEDPDEVEAAKSDLSYIPLDGDIACMVNGAGLAMATMDIIKLYGGEPANFLDVGGGATTEKVSAAFKLMLRNPRLKAVLINIFGGIMRCDVIAQGVTEAAKGMAMKTPLVVRLEGTNVEAGKKILADSGLAIIPADSMADAAQKAVEAARQAG